MTNVCIEKISMEDLRGLKKVITNGMQFKASHAVSAFSFVM